MPVKQRTWRYRCPECCSGDVACVCEGIGDDIRFTMRCLECGYNSEFSHEKPDDAFEEWVGVCDAS